MIFAGVVAAILTVGPAQAFHKGVVHGGGGGPGEDIQTLDSLAPCDPGQVPKKQGDGNNWSCEADTVLDQAGVEALGFVTGAHTGSAILTPKLVFLTSGGFVANLGSLAAYDEACQTAADGEGLGGIFMAWLSDDTNTPTTRFTALSLGPYYMLDGRIVAANFADLVDGAINAGISIDETGFDIGGGVFAWTGTKANGTHERQSCLNWNSGDFIEAGVLGTTGLTDFQRTIVGGTTCDSEARLYCFEQ